MKVCRLFKLYIVWYLIYDFFKDFIFLNYYQLICFGSKVGDFIVIDFRVLRYLFDGIIGYKLYYDGDEFLEFLRWVKFCLFVDDDVVGSLYQ